MEPKQLVSLHQSAQSFGGMNMQVNTHGSQSNSLLSRTQMLNETSDGHVSRLQSSTGQPIMSTGCAIGVLAQNNNARGPLYIPVSIASSTPDFSVNNDTDLSGSSFPLGSNAGMSTFSSKGVLQEEFNSETKGSRGSLLSYDILNELHQQKSHVWGSQNVGLTYDASQHANIRGSLDVSPAVLVQQGFSSFQNVGQNRNAVSKAVFSARQESGHGNAPNFSRQLNTFLVDSSPSVKAERLPDSSYQNILFPEQFSQEDLMSVLLKQQQEGTGLVESEFGFDGHPLDNLPV
ncbi:unnamed protein product [Ilex paraguariensis]|uniref:Uncharacterized protein n=1 Tax=Ilex paraguariensis TaxID=185542 RepID=A0ABC8R1P1_9AQUA